MKRFLILPEKILTIPQIFMTYQSHFFLAVLFAFLGGFVTNSQAEQIVKSQSFISVNGVGRLDVAPDRADLTLAIETQDKSAEAARDQAAMTMKAVISALHDAGVNNKDMQTRYVALMPIYEPNANNKISAYQLTNQLAIKVRDINKSSTIMDLAIKTGGNAARVQNISFAIDNPESALKQARENAFLDAKTKAEQYATLANVKLGKPQQIIEGGAVSSAPAHYADMAVLRSANVGAESTPIQVGEQEVSVSVNVVFAIE